LVELVDDLSQAVVIREMKPTEVAARERDSKLNQFSRLKQEPNTQLNVGKIRIVNHLILLYGGGTARGPCPDPTITLPAALRGIFPN